MKNDIVFKRNVGLAIVSLETILNLILLRFCLNYNQTIYFKGM